MITSNSNEKIKRIHRLLTQKKARRESGCIICEGVRIVRDIPKSYIKEIYATKDRVDEMSTRFAYDKTSGIRIETVAPEVLDRISDTKHSQGVMAVCEMPQYRREQVLGSVVDATGERRPLVLVLEDISDPGNLGTIFRVAEASGVTGLMLSAKTTDVSAPKVVRSTMSSLFRMPFVVERDMEEALRFLREKGVSVYVMSMEGMSLYGETHDFTKPVAFVLGNEAHGVSGVTKELCDGILSLPMEGAIESLNVAMTAGIVSYEALRQRKSLR